MEIDLSLFRQMVLSDSFEDLSAELKIFDNQDCCFYYDESNNTRKLWLAENDFNAPVDSDFVLGGVMHFDKTCKADVDALKKELRLQKSAKEIKFKHISKGKTFVECLSEQKVGLFLQWLHQSDLYVHFAHVNNLYWAIVDIIDTIEEPTLDAIQINKLMKNELYKVARSRYNDFYQLLVQYNYPNIETENIRAFYQNIVDFIEYTSNEPHFELEYLRQLCKAAREQSDLVFLQGNTERTVIDSYFPFYMRPIGVFSSAQHIFDNEYQIEEQFRKYGLLNTESKEYDFNFVNSIDNKLIQVSDCIVGLLGKYYTYVNRIDFATAGKMLATITDEQKGALKLFSQIIKKSEDFCKLLLNSIESIEEHDIGAFILTNALFGP